VWLFGFRNYPHSDIFDALPTPYDWLDLKKQSDGIEGNLWRIYDELYDLSDFDHPGGDAFLEITRGTDITELVESSHLDADKVRALLPKYRVGLAAQPRNCNFTFHEDGFYCTLRRRVFEYMKEMGDKCWQRRKYWGSSACCHDALLLAFLATLTAAMVRDGSSADASTCVLLCVAGALLAMLAISAHNFFHQRDSWRMRSFDLTGLSSHDWRVSHVYSHHCYPNSFFDYEASSFVSVLSFYPQLHKRGVLARLRAVLALGAASPAVLPLTVRTRTAAHCSGP
jgi:hypothetical protein